MRRMTPALLLTLGLAVLMIGFTGCAGKKAEPEPQQQVEQAPERKPAPRPQVQRAPEREQEEVTVPRNLEFNTVYFDFDDSSIRSDQRSRLIQNAELLQKYPSVTVRVEGHCDERGTDEYNLALGERRAESVKRFLIEYGINGRRVTTISYGESQPAVQGHNESAWSRNRRCEFDITSR